ncbi:MAG: copper chaperone CopZ [Spirochaetales bacterium]|jgi:copper chaperone|nr:copper chaperone CopZ [Spirochaetales bacterium]
MTSKIINVEGMSCDHCKMAVTKAVSALEGVSTVEVSLENKTVSVDFEEDHLPFDAIKQAIEGQGYDVV